MVDSRHYGCDGRHIRPSSDCHYKENHMTKRWRCRNCDYDLCLECALTFNTHACQAIKSAKEVEDQYVFIWHHNDFFNAWKTSDRKLMTVVFEKNKSAYKAVLFNGDIIL